MKKMILISSFLILVAIAFFNVSFLMKTPHVCEGESIKCYVEEPVLEIANDYNNIINNHKCLPKQGVDIFILSKHSIPAYIRSVNTNTEKTLQYQITIPTKFSNENIFSIVIDELENKIYTGEEYYRSHHDLPNLIKKDPSYLKNSFKDFLNKNNSVAGYKLCI